MKIKNINRISDSLQIILLAGLISVFSKDIKNVFEYSKYKHHYERNGNALGDRVYTPKTIKKEGEVSTLYNFATNKPTSIEDQQLKIKEVIEKILEKVDRKFTGRSSSEILGLGEDHNIWNFSGINIKQITGSSSDEYNNNGIGEKNVENDTLALERANQFHNIL